MFKTILGTITSWFKPVTELIDELHTSDEEKQQAHAQLAEIQLRLRLEAMKHIETLAQTQASVVLGEIQGKSWMQRNWRPLLMMICIIIIANNFIIAPYVAAFGGVSVALELPQQLWALMTIGVGGYIGGRTYEKKTQTDAFLRQIELTHGKEIPEPEAEVITDDELINDH